MITKEQDRVSGEPGDPRKVVDLKVRRKMDGINRLVTQEIDQKGR
jgi:urease beta subunit